jgi:hypothetical protein
LIKTGGGRWEVDKDWGWESGDFIKVEDGSLEIDRDWRWEFRDRSRLGMGVWRLIKIAD